MQIRLHRSALSNMICGVYKNAEQDQYQRGTRESVRNFARNSDLSSQCENCGHGTLLMTAIHVK